MTHTRIFALLMAALTLCTLFAGCSGSSGTGTTTPAANSGGVVIPPSQDGLVYAASFVDLDDSYKSYHFMSGSDMAVSDGCILMPAWVSREDADADEQEKIALLSVAPDGSDVQEHPIIGYYSLLQNNLLVLQTWYGLLSCHAERIMSFYLLSMHLKSNRTLFPILYQCIFPAYTYLNVKFK